MSKRLVVVLATIAAVLAGLITGSGEGAAAPELQRISINGDRFATVGNHSFCNGELRVSLTAAPRKPGFVRVGLTSYGFSGQGPSWKRNPVCKLLIGAVHTSAIGYAQWSFFNADFGPKRGQKVVRDIRTGSGVVELQLSSYARNNPIRLRQSLGLSYYMLVP
ncbi:MULTISPECIES: enoyl-CoA hydratase [unclassified Gordonia (in: high G+C Gram-positive bacteria)]|uniref:enoyl-CoA hydratase n=1 Tax=unclassified Gordonia (in: high G+C Gram-positive bacteria) TaxID=2657482 RepID=UPI000815D76B|nr:MULTISPECIES: enoyl-CoA hydratase [unclassified Gordonia (in: high G+C Gram-positive bacteria)]SCC61289.1 hypothetical protein GA0061091_1504 [Gordonia sp. v-85]